MRIQQQESSTSRHTALLHGRRIRVDSSSRLRPPRQPPSRLRRARVARVPLSRLDDGTRGRTVPRRRRTETGASPPPPVCVPRPSARDRTIPGPTSMHTRATSSPSPSLSPSPTPTAPPPPPFPPRGARPVNRNGSGGSFVLFGKSGARDHSGSYLCASVAGASDSRMAAASATGVEDRRIASSRPSRNDASTTGASGPDARPPAAARTAPLESREMRDGGVWRLRGDPRALRRLGRLGRAASFRRAGIDRLGRERRRRRHPRQPASRGGDQSEMPFVVVLGAQRARVLVRVLHLLRGRAPRVRQRARQRRPRRLRLHPCLRPALRRFRLCSPPRVPAPSRTFCPRPGRVRPRDLRAPTPTRRPSPVARAVARRRGPTRPHTVSPRRGSKTTSSSGNPRATKEIDASSARTRPPVVTRTRAVRVSPVGFESHRPVQARRRRERRLQLPRRLDPPFSSPLVPRDFQSRRSVAPRRVVVRRDGSPRPRGE